MKKLLAIEILTTTLVVSVVSIIGANAPRNLSRYPENSPKGPKYCHNRKEFRCMDMTHNTQHLFCGCHKYPCERYEPENMTRFRQFNLMWHNTYRGVVSAGSSPTESGAKEDITIMTGEQLPKGASLKAMSYNYNMEDGARCSAKKCVVPVVHDHCHATPQFPTGSGSGQNIEMVSTQALQCKRNNAPVQSCDLNTMDQYEVVSYVAMRTWFEEVKNIQNLSILTSYALPPLPQEIVPKSFKQYANFIAMIWADTDQMGCAVTKSPDEWKMQFFYVTCHYHPSGNVLGQPVFATAGCPPGSPKGQSKYWGLCGKEDLPPEPPNGFFVSIPMSEYMPKAIGRTSGANTQRGVFWLVFVSVLSSLLPCTT